MAAPPSASPVMRSATTDEWYQQYKTPCSYPDKATLHELFRESAKKHADKLAIEDPLQKKRLTYRELDYRSDLLCKFLRMRGVRFEHVVGIYMEKSVEFMVAYIAALKAGGAYMPLEIAYPVKLLATVIDDSKPTVVCCKAHCAGNLPDGQNTFNMDDGWVARLENDEALQAFEDPRDDPAPHPDSLAYVVYSSGTTGKPKGICCPHRGSVFSYHWRHESYPFIESDRIGCNIFYTWEAFRPFMKGAVTVVIADELIYDPRRLVKFLQDEKITRILMTPSLCQTCLDAPGLVESHDLSKLRIIVLCGEVVTADLTARIRKLLPHTAIPNLYSISECHDVSCVDLSKVELDSKYAKCGYVFDNVDVYVLNDETKRVVPRGLKGGVYVAGCTLAIGYLNRPKMTAERFFMWRDPDKPDAKPIRLYYTGDNGLLRADGQVEILGRAAFFVKIRGYSVVLGQIEVALLEHPAVKSCSVQAVGAEGEDKHLVAYLVINGSTEIPSKTEIVKHVSDRVPSYSVPPNYVVLEQLPLSMIGKLDSHALPKLEACDPSQLLQEDEAATSPLSTATEKELGALWSANIEVEVTSALDNYFFKGGHSLAAGALLRNVKKHFSVELRVADIYKAPVLRDFAALIDSLREGGDTDEEKTQSSEVDLVSQADAQLPSSLAKTWDAMPAETPSRVLLTGATGFLGAYLLHGLRKRLPEAEIIALGRGNVAARVQANLQRYGLYETGILDNVRCVQAKLAEENVGLSEDLFKEFAGSCDMILHCAAETNLVKSYADLKPVNVGSVLGLLGMAATGRPARFVYISTNGVFEYDGQAHKEDAAKPARGRLNDGYCQSKSVAEDIVLAAGASGLPVQIHRMGNLVGDAARGVFNKNDFLAALFSCGSVLGFPALPDWKPRLTPVDWAANAVVGLALSGEWTGAAVFHIANGSQVALGQLATWFESPQTLKFGTFLERVHNTDTLGSPQLKVLQAMLAAVEQPKDMEYTRLGQLIPSRSNELLAKLGLEVCPPITEKHVAAWRSGLTSQSIANQYRVKAEDLGIVDVPR